MSVLLVLFLFLSRANCEDDGSLFNDEINFGASTRNNWISKGRFRKKGSNKKIRRNNFNSKFIDNDRMKDTSQIATIVQNPDFPVNFNEIVQVNGPSLFDNEGSLPDYDTWPGLHLTPDEQNSRQAQKKYKAIEFGDRRTLDNNLGSYGQVSVTNTDNTTLVHGQSTEGKNTQIIINLTHQPKSYLYGNKPYDEKEVSMLKPGGHNIYRRPKPVGPPIPTQPAPPDTTLSPIVPVGPPAPPVRPIQGIGPTFSPNEVRPPSLAPSIFRNDVLRNQNRYNQYRPNDNSLNGNSGFIQDPQNYPEHNRANNPQSDPEINIHGVAQPRSFFTPSPQNNPISAPANSYGDRTNRNPISSSTLSFSPSLSNQYGNNNEQSNDPLNDNTNYYPRPQSTPTNNFPPSQSFSPNNNYSPPPQSAPQQYAPPSQAFSPNTNYSPPPQLAPQQYVPPTQAFSPNSNYSPPPQSPPTTYVRPVAIPPKKTYFLPPPPPVQAPTSPPNRPQSTYQSPAQQTNFAPYPSYASQSQQSDPVLPPGPPPPPPTMPAVIDTYNVPQVAAPPKQSYNPPQENPPSNTYGVPQSDPPQAPPASILYQPGKISISFSPHQMALQQPNMVALSPSKPSYKPQQAPQEQTSALQLAPATFDILQDPTNDKEMHFHVHVKDMNALQALDQMFAEGTANDVGTSYGAPALANPPTIYGAPLADPPAPPPRPQYQPEPLSAPPNNYMVPQADPPAPPPRPQPQYGAPMQLTPPRRPLMVPRAPTRQRNPMYGRPNAPNAQRNPLANGISGLASFKLNSKANFVVGATSKLKELIGIKCFLWCKFDQLEFADRRSDNGLSDPVNQFNSPQSQMATRPRSRSNRRTR